MEKTRRGNGLWIALIVVCMLIALLVFMRYSFKHDLPAATFLRAQLGRGAAGTAPADIAAAPAAKTPAPTTQPDGDMPDGDKPVAASPVSYDTFLRETLLVEYGMAEPDAVADALFSGYAFPEGTEPPGATGLCSAQTIDLDGDSTDELVVLCIRRTGGVFSLEALLYGMEDGVITPSASAVVIENLSDVPAAQSDCIEIVSQDGGHYLLYHRYVEDAAGVYDRYIAFDIAAKKAEPVLDGTITYADSALALISVAPPWLDAALLSGAPTVTDPISGSTGARLYADDVTGAAESIIIALEAMLGPLAGVERTVLLDPLYQDWTGLTARLSGQSVDETSEAFDGYDAPAGYEEPPAP